MFGLGKKETLPVNEQDRSWYMLEKIINESQAEQKRARRWGTFFKLLTFLYLLVVVGMFFWRGQQVEGGFAPTKPHVGVVKVKGPIAEDQDASANNIVQGLRQAFENPQCKAIILAINSPGGSPVQANYVYDEIKRLRLKYPAIQVYAVVSDIGASGAYYIASAADYIYAAESSLIGSIGVTAAGFGFVEAIDKLGIERRNFTSGEHKSFLDPFQPQREDEKQFWESVLKLTHEQFIKRVRDGRGGRLKETPEMFSGLIWNGEQAMEMGLIDGLGSAGFVAREVVKQEKMFDYTVQRRPIDLFLQRMGTSVGAGIVQGLGLSTTSPITLQ